MHLCHVAFDEAAFCCKAKVQRVIKFGGGGGVKKEEKKVGKNVKLRGCLNGLFP